jgi:Ca-activated chloride channel family protein
MNSPVQGRAVPNPFNPLALPERAAALAPHIALLIVSIIAAIFGSMPRLNAQERASPASITMDEVKAGSLLLRSTEQGRYVEAPRLATDIDLTVSGPTARARVTQAFRNPTNGWVEAVYVYPLPEGAAVDALKMVIGDRIVVGEIKEREQARQIYEQAKSAGQKATLLEQKRPNVFTNSVANIGPGETVLVQIEYQEPVRQSGDQFSLRVPLVVAPRYHPRPVAQTVDFMPGTHGWGTMSRAPSGDDRIDPPVLDPREHAPINPVSLSVRLQAGFPLGEVKSHHHQVAIKSPAEDTRLIALAEGTVPADRDFELTWKPAASTAPSVGLFRERVGDADYVLAFVTPPALAQQQETRPREVIFVIDNSGSMGGTSIAQAKASLVYALGRLKPTDRFNVIRFDHTMDMLFHRAVPADKAHVAQAQAYVVKLQAQGGTEMVPPMKAALAEQGEADASHLRQVVFLTDGAISNEQQLLDTLSAMRGRSRVFMVGIGSAPNTFLMSRAAEIGRGTFTHIASAEQVEERMRSLFEKLESPVVTNLSATLSDANADVTPALLPDLYRGEPVVLAAKVSSLTGTIEVRGRIGDRPWVATVPLANAAEGRGLSKLWARRKITDAEVARTLRKLKPDEADAVILALALDHHLVTNLTSLVAVDKTPSRPDGAPLMQAELPLNLPAGWDFDKVFGERRPGFDPVLRRADGALDAGRARHAFAAVLRSAQPVAAVPNGQGGVPLPMTATDAELRMWCGALLTLMSLMMLAWLRRRRLAGARA